MAELTLEEIVYHEAGHVIVTLGSGCLLYDAVIGNIKGRSTANSAGHVSRGTQSARQSAVIGVAGAMAEALNKSKCGEIDMDEFLDVFYKSGKYKNDRANTKGYPMLDAAYEAKGILVRRWEHLERLVKRFKQPKNHDRIIGAAELFQWSGCRLLNSRKLPVPKRKIQAALARYTDRGYHQWSVL